MTRHHNDYQKSAEHFTRFMVAYKLFGLDGSDGIVIPQCLWTSCFGNIQFGFMHLIEFRKTTWKLGGASRALLQQRAKVSSSNTGS